MKKKRWDSGMCPSHIFGPKVTMCFDNREEWTRIYVRTGPDDGSDESIVRFSVSESDVLNDITKFRSLTRF